MNIISKNASETNTFLKIVFREDMSEEFGNTLPFPSKHFLDGNFTYYWLIRGFFNTKNSCEYINDIKARFLITYKEQIKDTKHYYTKENQLNIFELKQFQNLKSISINIINQTNRFDSSKDMVFWCLKMYCEDIIEERGLCDYDTLLRFGEKHLKDDTKDFSTLKSKCRSIINYYINKNYELDKYRRKMNDEELSMSRSKNMTKVREKIRDNNTTKIKNFLSGMFIEEYKKPNGKWNVSLISKELNVSRNTIYRVIKEENL